MDQQNPNQPLPQQPPNPQAISQPQVIQQPQATPQYTDIARSAAVSSGRGILSKLLIGLAVLGIIGGGLYFGLIKGNKITNLPGNTSGIQNTVGTKQITSIEAYYTGQKVMTWDQKTNSEKIDDRVITNAAVNYKNGPPELTNVVYYSDGTSKKFTPIQLTEELKKPEVQKQALGYREKEKKLFDLVFEKLVDLAKVAPRSPSPSTIGILKNNDAIKVKLTLADLGQGWVQGPLNPDTTFYSLSDEAKSVHIYYHWEKIDQLSPDNLNEMSVEVYPQINATIAKKKLTDFYEGALYMDEATPPSVGDFALAKTSGWTPSKHDHIFLGVQASNVVIILDLKGQDIRMDAAVKLISIMVSRIEE